MRVRTVEASGEIEAESLATSLRCGAEAEALPHGKNLTRTALLASTAGALPARTAEIEITT